MLHVSNQFEFLNPIQKVQFSQFTTYKEIAAHIE